MSFTTPGTGGSFTVPAGVSSLSVTLYGGAGGGTSYSGRGVSGGDGALVTATLTVTPGEARRWACPGGQRAAVGRGGHHAAKRADRLRRRHRDRAGRHGHGQRRRVVRLHPARRWLRGPGQLRLRRHRRFRRHRLRHRRHHRQALTSTRDRGAARGRAPASHNRGKYPANWVKYHYPERRAADSPPKNALVRRGGNCFMVGGERGAEACRCFWRVRGARRRDGGKLRVAASA